MLLLRAVCFCQKDAVSDSSEPPFSGQTHDPSGETIAAGADHLTGEFAAVTSLERTMVRMSRTSHLSGRNTPLEGEAFSVNVLI